jgi:hypothetical protein
MNLHSEVILNLALTSLIGLWLIWQAIKINSNIDIFQIVVNWFRDRPIILPSLFFSISPFVSAYIFHNLQPDFNQIFDNKILVQVLTTFGAVISIYIGNRALESFRKIQGQKKVAKIIIVSMEGHLDNLEEILKYLNENLSESLMHRIDNKVNQIRKNYIYESALKEVGILASKHIDIISKSSIALNSILDETPRVYDMQQKFQDRKSKTYVRLGIEKIVINIQLDKLLCI